MLYSTATPVILEPEYLQGFRQIHEEKIIINKALCLKLNSVTPESPQSRSWRGTLSTTASLPAPWHR